MEPLVTASPAAVQAKPKAFRFFTSLVLQESTGLRASTLGTLAKLLRTVPDSSIYHHTHYFLLQHHYLTPEPANDFAYWVTEVFGEEPLGELLASIDIMEHSSLQSLREAVATTIEGYLKQNPPVRLKFVSEGQEFFFLKSVHVVMPTPHSATNLAEFAEVLEQVSINSLYHHIFDARLRIGQPTNDFALWISQELKLPQLGDSVSKLDPYMHTLETLRSILLSLVRQQLVSG
jgi:hypothetical protein